MGYHICAYSETKTNPSKRKTKITIAFYYRLVIAVDMPICPVCGEEENELCEYKKIAKSHLKKNVISKQKKDKEL